MQKESREEDKLVLHYHDVVIRQSVSCLIQLKKKKKKPNRI